LTVANLAVNYFEIAVIPKTWTMTNFHVLQSGDAVNLEADITAKYIERILQFREVPPLPQSTINLEKLENLGFK
jgi:riboflavin synthase